MTTQEEIDAVATALRNGFVKRQAEHAGSRVRWVNFESDAINAIEALDRTRRDKTAKIGPFGAPATVSLSDRHHEPDWTHPLIREDRPE
jgi:hypothetical protein